MVAVRPGVAIEIELSGSTLRGVLAAGTISHGRLELATDRGGEGTVAFHVAEFHVPAKDGRFIARIGHGTEPVPA